MLIYMIVVNDAGELKTLTAKEFEAALDLSFDKGERTEIIENALNKGLDEKAIAGGEYDPSDNDTPMTFTLDGHDVE